MSYCKALYIVFVLGLYCLEAQQLKVEVSAKSAILLNAETGTVLYEKNAHQSMYPASITKMITAMYALEKMGHALQEQVTVSHDAVAAVHPNVRRASTSKHPPYRLEFGGSSMGVKAGEVLSFESLLYGLMLASGNDAANAIAQHVSGNVGQFMLELNAYIKDKGCQNTTLHTPHGLPHDEHTTAYDMALLAREAMKHPKLRQVVKTVAYTRQASNLQPESLIHQHNALLKPGGKFYYPKAMGIKTGYTLGAGYTLVAAAEDSQRKLIAVLLGCEQMEQRYKDAIALFETAFNEKRLSRMLFAKDFDFFSSSVKGGKMPIEAFLKKDVTVDYYPSEDQPFQSRVLWYTPKLPIAQGEKVGEVHILTSTGQMVSSSTLYAAKAVDPTFRYAIQMKWALAKHVALPLMLGLVGCAVICGTHFRYRKKSKN